MMPTPRRRGNALWGQGHAGTNGQTGEQYFRLSPSKRSDCAINVNNSDKMAERGAEGGARRRGDGQGANLNKAGLASVAALQGSAYKHEGRVALCAGHGANGAAVFQRND